MDQPRPASPGNTVASLVETLPARPMAPCAVPPEQRWLPPNSEERTDGSLRVVYEARLRDGCPRRRREHCQWHGQAAKHPRRVSLLLHPLAVASAPLRLSRLEPAERAQSLPGVGAQPTGG